MTKLRLKYGFYYLVFISIPLFLMSCTGDPVPDTLSPGVRQTFSFLPEKPQFVMYANFRNMRVTDFWKVNISDSMFAAENTFGSMLNIFKSATGVSVSSGLDEMYFANSWTGENAIVLKGSFDRNKFTFYISTDTSYRKTANPDGIVIYTHIPSSLMFFFKDNYTLCASNYQKQIDIMKQVNDSAFTGLASNTELMKAINGIMYKENIWMITSEKAFIRGIIANLTDINRGKNVEKEIFPDSLESRTGDSLTKQEDILMNNMYEKINSLSINVKMKKDLTFNLQFEAIDTESAVYIKKLLNGIIIFAKLSSSAKKDVNSKQIAEILDKFEINTYNTNTIATVEITGEDIGILRAEKNLPGLK
jgi:hypothetical protein